jgi:hypothetical protein
VTTLAVVFLIVWVLLRAPGYALFLALLLATLAR